MSGNRLQQWVAANGRSYFKDEEEPVMSSGRTVQGMANMAAVKGYIVAAAKADHSNELALYVTQDTET